MVRSQQPGQILTQVEEGAMRKFQVGKCMPASAKQAQDIVERKLAQGDKTLQILEKIDLLFQEWQAAADLNVSWLILRWGTAANRADVQPINL